MNRTTRGNRLCPPELDRFGRSNALGRSSIEPRGLTAFGRLGRLSLPLALLAAGCGQSSSRCEVPRFAVPAGYVLDEASCFYRDPGTGFGYDASLGLFVAPNSNVLVNADGFPVDSNGQLIAFVDPATGYTFDPTTGYFIEPGTNFFVNANGEYVDPATGQVIGMAASGAPGTPTVIAPPTEGAGPTEVTPPASVPPMVCAPGLINCPCTSQGACGLGLVCSAVSMCVTDPSFVPDARANRPTGPFTNTTLPFGVVSTTFGVSDARIAWDEFRTNHIIDCGGGVYRVQVSDVEGETFSEGIAYGMIASAYYGDLTIFDGLWQYYKNARNGGGLMNWHRRGCENQPWGAASDNNGASDADVDAAYALVYAACGVAGGAQYGAEAATLIAAIKNGEMASVNGVQALLPGDAFGSANCLNPSYFSPAYYRVFANFTNDNYWLTAADDAITLVERMANPTTGLVRDWSTDTGGVAGCGGDNADKYHYDAARTPWRMSLDYLWFGTPRSQALAQRWTTWVNTPLASLGGGGIAAIGDLYDLSGARERTFQNTVLPGAFAVASMAADQTSSNDFGNFIATLPTALDITYFSRALRTLYGLVLSGQFQAPPCQ